MQQFLVQNKHSPQLGHALKVNVLGLLSYKVLKISFDPKSAARES